MSPRIARVGTWLLLAGSAILLFPGPYEPLAVDLDPSWKLGLNLFSGLRFGQDLIFTYGPLGFLAHPRDVGDHLALALAFRLLLQLAVLGIAAALLLEERTSGVALFLLGLPLYAVLAHELDYEVLGLSTLLLALAVTRTAGWLLIPPAALAAVLLLVKFGSGIAALAEVCWACVLWLLRGGRPAPVAAAAGTWLVAFLVLSGALVGGPGAVSAFLERSFQIVSGYGRSMSRAGEDGPVWVALILCALLAGATLRLLRRGSPVGLALLVAAVPVVYSLKHGFVRNDWSHADAPFQEVLQVSLVALLLSSTRAERGIGLGLLLAALAGVGITYPRADLRERRAALAEVVTGRRGGRNVVALLHPAETRRALAERSARNLEPDRVPAEWRSLVGDATVLVVPWEIAACAANGFRCVPFPTLQMYSAYTPGLDRWAAERLEAVRPEFVLASARVIDDRNLLWDCPATWRTLIAGWVPVREERRFVLLRRRTEPRAWREVPGPVRELRVGEWTDVPVASAAVARLTLRGRWIGAVRTVLLRAPAVMLEVRTLHGEVRTYRLVVDTAGEGLLLDAAPRDSAALAEVFRGAPSPDPVRAIRLSDEGSGLLRPIAQVSWSELETGPEPSAPR